jgi:hypothetical protein
MSAVKSILKLTHNEANVKVTATAAADTATITVDSDLKLGSDTTAAAWEVVLDKVLWTCSPISGAYITVVRNAVLIVQLYGSGEMNLNALGMADDQQKDKDLVVTFVGGSGGVIYLKLKKRAGYGD